MCAGCLAGGGIGRAAGNENHVLHSPLRNIARCNTLSYGGRKGSIIATVIPEIQKCSFFWFDGVNPGHAAIEKGGVY